MTDIYDDYWKPEEQEPSTSPPIYEDTWKEDETEPYAPVTDGYWTEAEPTPGAPDTGKAGPDDSDYWDATCTFESFQLQCDRRGLTATVCET